MEKLILGINKWLSCKILAIRKVNFHRLEKRSRKTATRGRLGCRSARCLLFIRFLCVYIVQSLSRHQSLITIRLIVLRTA